MGWPVGAIVRCHPPHADSTVIGTPGRAAWPMRCSAACRNACWYGAVRYDAFANSASVTCWPEKSRREAPRRPRLTPPGARPREIFRDAESRTRPAAAPVFGGSSVSDPACNVLVLCGLKGTDMTTMLKAHAAVVLLLLTTGVGVSAARQPRSAAYAPACSVYGSTGRVERSLPPVEESRNRQRASPRLPRSGRRWSRPALVTRRPGLRIGRGDLATGNQAGAAWCGSGTGRSARGNARRHDR